MASPVFRIAGASAEGLKPRPDSERGCLAYRARPVESASFIRFLLWPQRRFRVTNSVGCGLPASELFRRTFDSSLRLATKSLEGLCCVSY